MIKCFVSKNKSAVDIDSQELQMLRDIIAQHTQIVAVNSELIKTVLAKLVAPIEHCGAVHHEADVASEGGQKAA